MILNLQVILNLLLEEVRKIWALTLRDMHSWATYKSQAFTTIGSTLLAVASWGFIGSFRNVAIPQYNTDYVSFLLVGIIISTVTLPMAQGIQRRLNPWTLETVLMSGIWTPTFVLGTVAWSYILAATLLVPQIMLGILIFGAVLHVNFLSLIASVVVSSVIVFSLSMISTGVRVVTKVSDPFSWGLMMAQQIFAGMTFPIQHLDNFIPGLSSFSWILPQTWIYHLMRLSALSNLPVSDPTMTVPLVVAVCIALVLLPIGLRVFNWGVNRAKRDGTLGWY